MTFTDIFPGLSRTKVIFQVLEFSRKKSRLSTRRGNPASGFYLVKPPKNPPKINPVLVSFSTNNEMFYYDFGYLLYVDSIYSTRYSF